MSDDPVEEFGRQLFGAAHAERPAPALRERLMRERLARRAPPTRARPARWLLLAALVGSATAFGSFVLQKATHEGGPSISAERRAPEQVPRAPGKEHGASEAPRAAPVSPPAAVEPVEQDATPRTPQLAEREKSSRGLADSRGPADAHNPAVPDPSSNTLVQELDWLKRARIALRAGDGPRALQLLQDFQTQYSGSDLKAEATLLQIEALAVAGRKAEASALAQRFVQEAPYSPLVDRAQSFIQPGGTSEQRGKEPTP